MTKILDDTEDNWPKDWQEAVDHMAETIRYEIDRQIMWEILYNDDMIRPLTDEEAAKRMMRVGGEVICSYCKRRYEDHPDETRVLSYDGYPFLKRLCDGTFGKT